MDLTPQVLLRPVEDADVADVLRANAAHVAMLSPLDRGRLELLRAWADRCDVVEVDGRFGGFVVTVAPGAAYDSENYAWFAARFGSGFYYLDRVVVEAAVRRRGVAGRVYNELERLAGGFGRMALEVNLEPPNPGSLAFHAARGYAEIGRLGPADHRVSLLVKELPAEPP